MTEIKIIISLLCLPILRSITKRIKDKNNVITNCEAECVTNINTGPQDAYRQNKLPLVYEIEISYTSANSRRRKKCFVVKPKYVLK